MMKDSAQESAEWETNGLMLFFMKGNSMSLNRYTVFEDSACAFVQPSGHYQGYDLPLALSFPTVPEKEPNKFSQSGQLRHVVKY